MGPQKQLGPGSDEREQSKLPASIEIERQLLGGILLYPPAFDQSAEILKPDDFFLDSHRRIYTWMGRLVEQGSVIDMMILHDMLDIANELPTVGGIVYLSSLTNGLPPLKNLEHYIKIVKDKSILRQVINIANNAVARAMEGSSTPTEVLSELQAQTFEVAETAVRGKVLSFAQAFDLTIGSIDNLHPGNAISPGMKTGFSQLDSMIGGLKPAELTIIGARPGVGKAQPLTSGVLTPNGFVSMGSMKIGDLVITQSGEARSVIGIFPQGPKEVFRVTMTDGTFTECCGEHLWMTQTRNERRFGNEWSVKSTASIRATLFIENGKRLNHRIPLVAPVELQECGPLPINPYLLGLLLGDGSFRGGVVKFHKPEADLKSKLASLLPIEDEIGERSEDGITIAIKRKQRNNQPSETRKAIISLGLDGVLSEDKFIPGNYLFSSPDNRLALLRGLLDTDGSVNHSGHSFEFSTSSKRLADGVSFLVRSLGGVTSVKERRTKYLYKGERRVGLNSFRFVLWFPNRLDCVSSEKHLAKQSEGSRIYHRSIRSIEPIGEKECQCILIDHPMHLYVTDDFIVTHNTSLALDVLRHAARVNQKRGLFFSLEMSMAQLVLRALCAEGDVDSHRIETGFATHADYDRLAHAYVRLADAPLFLDDTGAITLMEMRSKARRMQADGGLDLIVVDYLQLIGAQGKFGNREQEVAAFSRGLKAIAKDLGVPVVALSQLKRTQEKSGRPALSDLRECVTGDTLVVLANGERVPIQELVDIQRELVSMGADWHPVKNIFSEAWMVGKRDIFEVRLVSGKKIRATAKHRILTGAGWKIIANCGIGDRVGVARSIPEPTNWSPEWSEARLGLLAHLIGDGSYIKHQPLRYSSVSEENLEFVRTAAMKEFGSMVGQYRSQGCENLVLSGNGNRWHPKGLGAWLKNMGIFGQRSHQKHIPQEVFQRSNPEIAIFLRHLWATDGCISLVKPSVSYSTNSPRLAADVTFLLLRFGIHSSTKACKKAGYRDCFMVTITGVIDLRKFVKLIGAFGPRVAPLVKLVEKLALTNGNTNVDTLPMEVWGRVKKSMKRAGISQREMAKRRGTSYGGAAHFKFSPSRSMLAGYAGILGDAKLAAESTDGIFWDEIVSIHPAGREDVYDLTVPGTHNWLADGIISHNSGGIEADADLVVLLYREEMHNATEENRGMAEALIAKNRNGMIGSVRLVFLPQFSSFRNAADVFSEPENTQGSFQDN